MRPRPLCYNPGIMRLTSDEIEFISRKIVKTLVARASSRSTPSPGWPRASAGITEELMREDKLNEEVREVLVQHSSEMQRSNITYTEMFKMVKRKLAKEKGIIL